MKIITILFFLTIFSKIYAQERLVNVNGNSLNVFTKGLENRKEKTPILIFENGLGVGLGNWDLILDELSEELPVLAYDRAGVNKSDKIFKMPTIKSGAENLKALLNTLNIPPPYILVGHSLGGVYIRGFAGYYPDEISALVFIDPADFTETKNDWNAIFRTIGVPEKKIDEMLYNRLYKVSTSKVDSLNFGPWSEREMLTELRRTDFAEVNGLPLPDVPVYFFVGGKFEVPLDQRSKDFDQEQFFHIKNNANMDRWKKLIYSTHQPGALIYLTHAGHYIQRDDAKSVIANIKILLQRLNEKTDK